MEIKYGAVILSDHPDSFSVNIQLSGDYYFRCRTFCNIMVTAATYVIYVKQKYLNHCFILFNVPDPRPITKRFIPTVQTSINHQLKHATIATQIMF